MTDYYIAGAFFTTYEATKQLYTSLLPSGVPQPFIHSAASGTAELASCLILTPAEVIKSNAQMLRHSSAGGSSKHAGSTSLEAWRMLSRSGGGGALRRLWSGYTALAARNLPFTAMQFPMFEFLRGKLWAWRGAARKGGDGTGGRDGEEVQEKVQGTLAGARSTGSVLFETGLVNGLSAGSSGAVAAVITTPSDVVKTRMMVVQKQEGREHGRRTRAGGLEVAKQVLQERGVKGLFRGGALRAVWTFVGSGLYLGTYEVCKVWLRGDKDVGEDDDDL